jgi:hypothetical protein
MAAVSAAWHGQGEKEGRGRTELLSDLVELGLGPGDEHHIKAALGQLNAVGLANTVGGSRHDWSRISESINFSIALINIQYQINVNK